MVTQDIRRLQMLNDLIAQTLTVLERRAATLGISVPSFSPTETFGGYGGTGYGTSYGYPSLQNSVPGTWGQQGYGVHPFFGVPMTGFGGFNGQLGQLSQLGQIGRPGYGQQSW